MPSCEPPVKRLCRSRQVYDISLIYSRISCLLMSRDVSIDTALRHELSPIPTVMFDGSGCFPHNNAKIVMKQKLACEVSGRMLLHSDVVVIDECASLWVIHWPSKGSVADYVENVWLYVQKFLTVSDVYLIFDRYHDYSTKSTTRSSRNQRASRDYQLMLSASLPLRSIVLTHTHTHTTRCN